MFGSNRDKFKNTIDPAKTPEPSNTTAQNSPATQTNQAASNTHIKKPQPIQPQRSTNMETLISESCKIEGNIKSESSVKVEGQVEGNISVKETLVIAEKGQVTGDVDANSLIVYGNLKGDSQLKEIHIQNGGHIDGNIKTHSLKVDPNATYNGVVTMTKESLKPAASIINSSSDKKDALASKQAPKSKEKVS